MVAIVIRFKEVAQRQSPSTGLVLGCVITKPRESLFDHLLLLRVGNLEPGVVLVGELIDVVHLQHEVLAPSAVHLEADPLRHHHRVGVLRPGVHDLLRWNVRMSLRGNS